jgi:hypothetical protein
MKELTFDKKVHKYYLDGKEIASVTQICSKPLPNTPTIQSAALYGTQVHSEIVKYFKKGKCKLEFRDKVIGVKNKINELFPQDKYDYIFEGIGYYEKEGIVFAGTCDLVIYEKGSEKVVAIVDFKTGQVQEWHALQLSGYNLIFANDKSVKLYDIYISKEGVKEQRTQFLKGAFLGCYKEYINPTDLSILPDEEKKISLIAQKFEKVLKVKRELEAVESDFETFKENLMKRMDLKGIKKFFYKNISFTKVDASFAMRLDSKKLKAEKPEIYQNYLTPSEISPSLRIKEIENKEEVIRDGKALH